MNISDMNISDIASFSYLRRPFFHTRSRKLYMTNKEAARVIVTERIGYFMDYYGVRHGISIGRIAIRNQKSRWGSCSKKGNLNFNYKLAFMPPQIRDYIIVHEICHIKEFNHGRGFWSLVAETVPDWKHLRKRLRGMERSQNGLFEPHFST
jgi:predicted metal-dependent hydrolase